MKPCWVNLINIFGTGRNVGKTTFACQLIEQLSTVHTVIGIKISPHFHHSENKNGILFKNDHIIISKETNSESKKDTSRMLQAGASQVYFIQCKDDYLKDAFEKLIPSLSKTEPIICESAAIQNIITPGYSIKLYSDEHPEIKNEKYEYQQKIKFQNNSFNVNLELFDFNNQLIFNKE